MCFKQLGAISTLNGKPVKFVNRLTYLDSNISSAESNVNINTGKTWTAIGRLSTLMKSNISDKIKWEFF